MQTAKDLRDSFKSFFASKNHQIVSSAPMVIKDDPTLMFTNAGMNQFKDIILGNVPLKYPRVADSQKCLRVSGKHNDLEEVGHDTYHHTMFEMLGNWSFGDYFKKDAIEWAWEYLVEVLKLDAGRLYATVFEGSAAEGLARDEEAAAYWQQFLPPDHILNGNKKDNFWEMGDTGPCGPCSEIHIDLRPAADRKAVPGETLVNKDHPQVIEIWNLVFMQYNRLSDGSLASLPAKVIDTGMGFERLCMAIQGKTSNYDTDIFQPVIQAIAKQTGTQYGANRQQDIAMRVIADHIRTIAFAITDGQLPSNAKAGYVIRRILRRAVRYGYTFLNRREPFMYSLLPALIDTMGEAYPELVANRDLISKVMHEEEDAFLRTLETGIRLLDRKMSEAKAANSKVISGTDAFTLYDTYGFPLDLTELILREHQMETDLNEFNAEMRKQKDRARNAAAVETGDWVVLHEGESRFTGYDETASAAHILRYRKVKQKNSELYQIVLDNTPFYAEKGGQVGDAGKLVSPDGKETDILDTKNENNLSVHLTASLPDDLTATFTAVIHTEQRRRSEANHSATHLLHQALREVLGNHVEQKGSFVSPDSLRFDFSHYQKLTEDELRTVERLVNKKIREDIPLEEHRNMPVAEAKALGAMALFGEKYGDEVRVVRFGTSVELCAGTHIPATGMIGQLRILAESSVAAGVRRIEAVTAEAADEVYYTCRDGIRLMRQLLNNAPDVTQALRRTLEENADMRHKLEAYVREHAATLRTQLSSRITEHNGIHLVQYTGNATPDVLRDIAFQLKGEVASPFAFVAGSDEGERCTLMLMLSDDLVARGLHAGQLIKQASVHIQGGGGGQPHFATAGGRLSSGLPAAITTLLSHLK